MSAKDAGSSSRQSKGKKQKAAANPAKDKKRSGRARRHRKESPPWLVPVLVFVAVLVVGVLALIASRAGGH